MFSRIFAAGGAYTGTAGRFLLPPAAGPRPREVQRLKTVIYLDVLLLVNFLAGYFLLLAAGLLAGCAARLPRLLLGAGLAALSSLILFAPELPYPVQILYKLGSGAAIVWAAFGYRGIRRFLCGVFWYGTLNLLLAGLAILVITQTGAPFVQSNNLAVYLRISPLLLLALAGVCCLAVELAVRFLGRCERPADSIGVELELCGERICLRAALDTGCRLKDPITCLPVLLVSYPDAETRLPQPVREFLDRWFRDTSPPSPPEGTALRLIPCATAEQASLLPGFAVGRIGLISPDGVLPLERTAVAFSRQSFGSEEYEALYGSDFL